MRELKREKVLVEEQLSKLAKKSKFHDDHLRIVDAWLSQVRPILFYCCNCNCNWLTLFQLIDEFRILAGDFTPPEKPAIGEQTESDGAAHSNIAILDQSPFVSALFDADGEAFERHLTTRASGLKDALSALFSRLPELPKETRDLQSQVAKLLAAEKKLISQLQSMTAAKDELEEQRNIAEFSFLKAKKEVDKSKSVTLAMIEMQNRIKPKPEPEANGQSNGAVITIAMASDESELARKSAQAVADKRKEQLEALEAENRKLTEQLTVANTRLSTLSDDDYAKTELYKAFRSQHEDVIKRINHLEATNVQLREEAQKLHAERTAFKIAADEECQLNCSKVEEEKAKMDLDLQRIRQDKNRIHMEKTVLEAGNAQHDLGLREAQALVRSGEDRVRALEAEVERLRLEIGDKAVPTSAEDMAGQTADQLIPEILKLRQQFAMLGPEMQSMQSAYTKARAQANRKAEEITNLEATAEQLRVAKRQLETSRFSERQAFDAKKAECDTLRRQGSKSSEIITQLKEAENKTRELCSNLEKQLAEYRDTMAQITDENRMLQHRADELKLLTDGFQAQVADVRQLLATKDAALQASKSAEREAAAEADGLRVRVQDLTKKLSQRKATTTDSSEVDMLRVCNPSHRVMRSGLTGLENALLQLRPQCQERLLGPLQASHLRRLLQESDSAAQ
jgi:E3 ubiquitin-protein ligase BRE1